MENKTESINSILAQSKKSHGFGKIVNLIKKKKIIIIIAVLLAGAGGYFVYGKINSTTKEVVKAPTVASVQKGDISITIQSDGNVVAKDGVDLSFSETGVRIEEVYVSEGNIVKKGDKIARIETDESYIDLQSAQASLQYAMSRLVELEDGATDSDLLSYQNSVNSAQATLDKTIYQNEYSLKDAERAVETAQKNLKLAEGGNDSTIVISAYNDLLSTSLSSINSLSGLLSDSDSILGIDNQTANDDYESYLSNLSSSNLNEAIMSYRSAKSKLEKAENFVVPLNSLSSHDNILAGANLVKDAFVVMQQHLYDMQKMLETTRAMGDFTQTELDGLRSTVSGNKTSVISGLNSLNDDIEAIDTAKNSYDTYECAYTASLDDLEKAKKDAQASEVSAKLSLENAQNSLNQQMEPASASDLASARSSVASAQSNVNKIWYQIQEATITSPIDGEVVLLNGKTGDIVVEEKNQPFCSILNKDVFYVETQIDESDINKIQLGQKAYATIDALDSAETEGEVSFVSLISSASNGIITYKVRVLLENTSALDIREGMSVYVDFVIAEAKDVLQIPVQAVKNVDGKPSVTMEDGSIRNVTTGFTDGKMVEIISGLELSEKVKY